MPISGNVAPARRSGPPPDTGPSIEEAIAEEKRIKGGNRVSKINLVNSINEEWNDLWEIVKEW